MNRGELSEGEGTRKGRTSVERGKLGMEGKGERGMEECRGLRKEGREQRRE